MYQNRWLFYFLLVVTLMMIHRTTSTPNYLYSSCSNTTIFANNSAYQTNLNTLFLSLSTNATNNPSGFYQTTVGNPPNETIYGQYLCRGDLSSSSCHDCVTSATTTDLPKTICPNRKIAITWYNECMVRYSNVSFFNQKDEFPAVHFLNTLNLTGNATQFNETLWNMTSNVMAFRAAQGGPLKKFATDIETISVSQSMYGLAQCTPDLTPSDCYLCLYSSIQMFISQSLGGRVLEPSCVVRYEVYPFFDFSQPPWSQGSNNPTIMPQGAGGRTKRFLHISLSIFIPISIVIAILLYFGIRRFKHKRKATQTLNNEGMDDIVAVESLRFDLNTIRSATSNFSGDNKLGQGGFGEVYKGTLENGQEIAVKRLSRNSKQGVTEFKTEVILVAKLQHKNLVKLLGFCVTSMENILIYEFLSNSSLDRFLFERTKKSTLDWQTRLNIILGAARGLLYLHEDSRLKVIHRDLKPSNILLDEGMNPKISDFGLAKLFEMDETQGDTKRIVGTYGYMAPEYAITGHYSVKSDVYSFGVILLEIVSGQKNRSFQPQFEEALLYRAWRLWSEDKAFELVDTALCNNFSREQVMQCIHIGLLCIQEDAYERPSMGPIVAALNGQSVSFSMPKAPYFLRSGDIGEASGEHSLPNIYTGGEQMTDLYSRD